MTNHIYRTVARVENITIAEAHIVISAIDPHHKFIVNCADLEYALGEKIKPLMRFMIMVDIGLDNKDVTGFLIADKNVFVGARP